MFATHDAGQARRLGTTVIGSTAAWRRRAGGHRAARRRRPPDRPLGVRLAGLRLELPAEAHPRAVAIDADDILVSLAPLASSARNQLRGRVIAIATDAGGVLLTVDCGQPIQARITPHSLASLGLAIGSEVCVTFKALAVHPLPDEG
ncbi:MAG: TOBE domain-containing protein [Candidatus Binatia bacterium]